MRRAAGCAVLVVAHAVVACGSNSTETPGNGGGQSGGASSVGSAASSNASNATGAAGSSAPGGGSSDDGGVATNSSTSTGDQGSSASSASSGGGDEAGGGPVSDAGAGTDATVATDGRAGGADASVPEAGGSFDGGGPFPWPAANQIYSEIVIPTFPAATFPVTNYGGKGDGQTDNTAAFQMAMQACTQAGGGHVTVPSGTFVTGAIHLLSNCDLHLETASTVLQFSGDVSKYPQVLTRFRGTELMNHSPMIYAYGQHDIGLTGSGVLDAQNTSSWQKDTGNGVSVVTAWGQNGTPVAQRVFSGGDGLRTPYVEPYNSQNVLIQGVTVKNGQFWNIHPVLSKNVTVDGVTVSATAQETDGCDPECSDHVVIENVNFKTGDDAVAIKSGRDNDGRRVHTPTTNILIRHVTFDDNYGILALGSEESGGIAHVFGYDMTAIDNHTRGVGRVFQYTLFMKANWDRGGVVDDIHLDTVKMYNLSGPIVYGDMTYNNITTGPFPPQFGNIYLSHITVDGAAQVFDVFATPTHPFGAITLSDCTFTNVHNTSNTLTDVQPAPVLTNVTVNGQMVH